MENEEKKVKHRKTRVNRHNRERGRDVDKVKGQMQIILYWINKAGTSAKACIQCTIVRIYNTSGKIAFIQTERRGGEGDDKG